MRSPLRTAAMWSVFYLYKDNMIPTEEDDIIDRNILRLFRVLFLLRVCDGNYEAFGLSWGDRQQYIYRMLSSDSN